MRIHNRSPRVMVTFLMCALLLALSGCNKTREHQSPQEKALGYFWYEAVFLDYKDVENAFIEASGRFPKYEYVPYTFHVSTSFMPDPKHEELYGTPVTVHIIGYANGSIQDVQENTTSDNEGLLVELSSTDKRMQALIDSTDMTYHITGSYTGGGKYTDQLDFANGTPLDITIEGVFGMSDNDGNVTLERQN